MKLKVEKPEYKGIVYLLYIWIDDAPSEYVVKIGVTSRSNIAERVCEIATSFFNTYRYFPRIYPKRFQSTEDIYAKEAELHRYYKTYRYESSKPFQGHTELFEFIPEDDLLDAYDKCMKGILDGK